MKVCFHLIINSFLHKFIHSFIHSFKHACMHADTDTNVSKSLMCAEFCSLADLSKTIYDSLTLIKILIGNHKLSCLAQESK